MNEKWNFTIYLVWFSYLILSAALMFGRGFLLSRKTLNDITDCEPLENFGCDGYSKSNLSDVCNEEEKIRRILANPGSEIACAPTRQRVVFILVDALRYDFTEYIPDLENPLPYQNRLTIINELLEKWPKRTRLFRFMADPPTTTQQRVKALVTGSLPTFIDASSNFAALELQEDNAIDQIVRASGKIVLLGDDTWARLIPGRWLRSHTMYSFHTWDLDTVDTEIDSKIYKELEKDDWDLLVAHYLGVDHAGHRYGPNHAEMTRKLDETNNRLKKIIKMLPPDVLLFVVGDHGMTETGDHGGESKAERTAAFFAYRGSGFGGDSDSIKTGKEVQQTDLAPTLCAALGRPPPAPCLGNLLLPVLPPLPMSHTLLHLSNNLKQIKQYLIRYGEESQQIPLDRLAQLINATREQIDKAATIETESELSIYVTDVRALIDNTRSLFRDVWVEFDSLYMMRALLLLLIAIFFNCLIAEGLPMDRIPQIFSSSFIVSGIIALTVCVTMCYTAFYLDLIEDLEHAILLSTGLISGVVICALVILHWNSITQRWYETPLLFYERFARAALIGSAVLLVSNSYIIEEGVCLSFLTLSVLATIVWHIRTIKAVALWACSGVVLAVSRSYRGCREEQGDCWTQGGGVNSADPASRAALVLALGSVAAIVAVARRHIGWRGHGVVVCGLFTCAHWAVGWGNLGSPSRSRLLARGAWLVIGCIFVLLWREDGRGAILPLTVCGLMFYIGNSLVLGVAYAPTAALALLSGILVLYIVSTMKNEGSTKFALSTRCSSSVACLWALMASYYFYGTGHHATLGHLRWAPAFHAGDPTYLPIGHEITAALVTLELFGMPLMFGAALPLLVLWGPGSAAVGPRSQLTGVFVLSLKFTICFAIRVFISALSATIHCRHLMIWGVFTPKLLFECGACLAAFVGTILGLSLTTWHLSTQQRQS
ncbi:GPI ethanolamine phosphate transferase 3 isoform X2 [Achroia grisella]|uniref:GPI ethanolamine phosphate transferase 3 isoform X2 n=1 Tax=Achroia grisella TaxID=688607 RepID=UPI0027D2F1FB|nr:GPI ethanolamine phosphate transferase 3 isoform X2 [Achroia grisella]